MPLASEACVEMCHRRRVGDIPSLPPTFPRVQLQPAEPEMLLRFIPPSSFFQRGSGGMRTVLLFATGVIWLALLTFWQVELADMLTLLTGSSC